MKLIAYKADQDIDISAPLTEFIAELCQFLPLNKLPPLEVLNLYLQKGEVDQGMSGRLSWEPFVITEGEYQEIASGLDLNIVVKPLIVNSEVDWYLWCFQEYLGVPMDKHRLLYESMTKLDKECQLAYDTNDDSADELHLKYIKASNKLDQFLDEYL